MLEGWEASDRYEQPPPPPPICSGQRRVSGYTGVGSEPPFGGTVTLKLQNPKHQNYTPAGGFKHASMHM